MTRKRFLCLAMAQRISKRVATFAADYAVKKYGSYLNAWTAWDGIVSGRFEMYVEQK